MPSRVFCTPPPAGSFIELVMSYFEMSFCPQSCVSFLPKNYKQLMELTYAGAC